MQAPWCSAFTQSRTNTYSFGVSFPPSKQESFSCPNPKATVSNHTPLICIGCPPEISLVTTATRRRPNCFQSMHQLHQLVVAGSVESAEEEVQRWTKRGLQNSSLAIGKSELSAALNLCSHMSPDLVKGLTSAAAKHGVVRGPINHDGLASPLLCLGGAKDLPDPTWKENMRTSTDSSSLQSSTRKI